MLKKNVCAIFGFMVLAAAVCEADEKGNSGDRLSTNRFQSYSSSSSLTGSSTGSGSKDAQGTLVIKDMPHQLTDDNVTFKLFLDRTRIYTSKGPMADKTHLTIPKSLIDTEQLLGAPMHYTVTHDRTNTVEAYGSCEMPSGGGLMREKTFEVIIDGSKLTKRSLEGFDVLIPECRVSLQQ